MTSKALVRVIAGREAILADAFPVKGKVRFMFLDTGSYHVCDQVTWEGYPVKL